MRNIHLSIPQESRKTSNVTGGKYAENDNIEITIDISNIYKAPTPFEY